jgi:hypothetical protein
MRTLVVLVCTLAAAHAECLPSVTTAIGTKAPAEFCSGELIFNEEFNVFDLSTWNHEKTAAGGGVSLILSLGLKCDNLETTWAIRPSRSQQFGKGKGKVVPVLN